MDEVDWEVWSHDARTGNPIERVHPQASSWSTGLTGDGYSTETFVANDAEDGLDGAALDALFEPNDRILARWWGDECILAQKVQDWDYSVDDGTVVVKTVDLITETEWRMVGQVDADKDLTLTVTNRSAGGAVRAVLARMMQWSSDWEFPIDLPADGSGSVSGVWEFWRKLRMSDLLQQIREQTGTEVYLRPYNAGAAGAKQLRFQTLVAPRITVGLSSFNLQAAESPLAGVRYKKDGSQQMTGLLGVGNGTGKDQETAWDGLMGDPAIIPIRDTKHVFADLTGAALQAATTEMFEANRQPRVQWTVREFTASGDWSPVHAAAGRGWILESHGDPVIPDSAHELRVIKVSGGSGRVLTVEVQDAA